MLFTTKEKTKDAIQYEDYYENGELGIDGQKEHRTDDAVLNPLTKFYSFYREKTKNKSESVPFIYQGEARLIRGKCIKRFKGDKPSKFFFEILADKTEDKIIAEIDNILNSSMQEMSEGAQKLVRHTTYERNPKIRAEALKIHPHRCEVCGFDFDKFYGSDFADGYIEIHHIEPISNTGVKEINPATDLVPVCANCHRMLHHRRNLNMKVAELRAKVAQQKSNH